MDKLTAIKIKYDDGTYSDEIPISVLSENVEWDSTHTLVDILGNIDVDAKGTIQDQISQLFNEKISATQLQNYVASQLNEDVSSWLNEDVSSWLNTNVNPVGSAVVVDSSLTISGAAADAKIAGDNISDLKSALGALGDGESLKPTIFHGKYYTGNVGEILQEVSDPSAIYTAIDVSPFVGQSLTIKLKSTNNSSRKFGFCNSESIIKAAYDELYSRNNFVLVDGWYEGVIPIIAEKFFFSYSFAGAGSVDPEFLIPTHTPLFIDAREKIFNNVISRGETTIPQEDYYLIGSEKRIWFSKLPSDYSPALSAGDIIRVLDTAYSIGYRVNNHIVNWSDKITVGDNFIGYGIRRNDLSDISDMTQAAIKSIVVIERNLYTARNNNKKVHISLDDCVFWADLITNNAVYKSAFQNSLLADLREIHYSTGATFTLNCFCSDGTHDISNVPETFKNDFSSNSDWLKFAFHAEDTTTHYNVDKVSEITSSYQKFVNAIYRMTGNVDCIDTVTRLGFFTGTIANVTAVRDQNCGINGLLTADDTRVSYYFNTAQNDYMILKGRMYDSEHNLLLIKTQPRLEYVTDIDEYCSQYLTPAYGNFINNLEFFTHEYEWNNSLKNKVLSLAEWLKTHSYQFAFWNT